MNKIFALGYVEFAKNKDIAAQVNGIDVIVGGHDHIFLYTGKYAILLSSCKI